MKHFLAALLCLLLWGCIPQADSAQPDPAPESVTLPEPETLYDPRHPMEAAYPNLVRVYPLQQRKVQGLRALGKDLLILSGQGCTTMTLYTGEDLTEAASLTLDFQLQQEDPSFQIQEHSVSFFDPQRRETLVLDHRLQEVRRIAAPENLCGKPLLSAAGDTLYYCTNWSVMAWDLETGIRRTIKELSCQVLGLTALHLEETILECSIQEDSLAGKLLLTADQGREIKTLPEDTVLHTGDAQFFTALASGYQTLLLFGDVDSSPKLLLPRQTGQQQFYLPEDHAAVTVCSSAEGIALDYYELSTGILRSSLQLEELQLPKSIVNTKGHAVYILTYDPAEDCSLLYRWDVLQQVPDPANTTSYRTDYLGPEHPDTDGLNACRERADAIGEKYGISIRIGEDAAAVQPWDYRFEPEYLAPVLTQELTLLEQRLAKYPEALFEQTKDHFAGITLCLVRKIVGTGEGSSLHSATGIQFFQDRQAYAVITTGTYSEQALYHELYHIMETHILTESTALDQWDSLNPVGFVYGSSQPDPEIYLQGQVRAFVDRYSMGAAKEDRARVFENAMLPEKEDVFQSEYMQRKLYALCVGIREAYRLKEHPDALPWEQYLSNPLT